jgi:hypothetical protein
MSDNSMPPFVQGSDTSEDAARKMRQAAPRMRKLVWEDLLRCGARGSTDEEAQRRLLMDGSTQRPRRIELWHKGMVIKTARRRAGSSGKLAVVWAVVPGKEGEQP